MGHSRWSAVIAATFLVGLPLAGSAGVWTAPKPTDKVENGVNWSSGFIEATAIGVAPPYATSPQHGRALAITAGALLARQELLAIAQGIAIDGQTTVQALMVADAVTQGRVSGVLRGAQIVATRDLGGGAVEVTVAVAQTGEFADLLLPRMLQATTPMPTRPAVPPTPAPAPTPSPAPSRPAPPQVVYSGLVIDARGLGVRPAMAPKVVSEGGQEVYGFSVVDRNWVVQQGMAGYSKDLPAAQSHERVTDRPLTIKALAAAGTNKTDIMIANADAQQLLGSGSHLAFLEKARVMIVVD